MRIASKKIADMTLDERRAYSREIANRCYWRNPEKARARAKALRAADPNPEATRAAAARYYAEHVEYFAWKNRAYKAANRDRCSARQLARKAKERAVYIEHVEPLVVLEMDDGVCGICGEDVDPFKFEVDHITPLARGGEHSYANTQPTHTSCNRGKRDRLQEKNGEAVVTAPHNVLVGG